MNEVIVYVEGPSDQLGMRNLFADLIEIAKTRGKNVDFFPLNGKEPLLNKGPEKAVNILRNKAETCVFLIPDLYPRNKPFPHEDARDLRCELRKRFERESHRKGCGSALMERFFVHCFKYDLEALLLASEEALLSRLGKKEFSRTWKKPVEEQNHDNPPKRIVEALFNDAGKKYKDTIDAPWILGRSAFREIAGKCPQSFAPFVEDLLKILEMTPA